MDSILFVDIPTYDVTLDEEYQNLLTKRLKLQRIIMNTKTQRELIRGQINYSRGLLSIATSARRKGIKTKYLVYSDADDRAQLNDCIINARYIAISALTPTIALVLHILRQAKKLNPQITTIVGGPHTQYCSNEVIENEAVDIVSVGDGIENIPLIAEGRPLHTIPNLLYKTESQTILNTITSGLVNSRLLLDDIVDYSLLSKQPSFYSHNLRTQNGCPFECTFCYESKTLSKTTCSKVPICTILQEIDYLNRSLLPNTLVHFSDPVFTLDKKRTISLCEGIAALQPQIVFSMDTRIDCIDDEIISALAKANILIYRFGIEDGNQKIVNNASKSIGVSSLFDLSSRIRRIAPNSIILVYWITGLPGTTMNTIKENANFLKHIVSSKTVDIVGNKLLVPYPGTDYADMPQKYGMHINTKDWRLYDRLSRPVYDLDTMNSNAIYDSFIYLEQVLVDAYESVVAAIDNPAKMISCDTLDYVYFSYLKEKAEQNNI